MIRSTALWPSAAVGVVLALICGCASTTGPTYVVTPDDGTRGLFIRTYDLRDLLVKAPDFEMPDFPGLPRSAEPMAAEGVPNYSADTLIDSFRAHIQPFAGAEAARISEDEGKLIVAANLTLHEQIFNHLAALRAQRSWQISVHVRLVTVQPQWLEQFDVEEAAVAPERVIHIDDQTLVPMLKAVQASRRGTIYSAPRITMFDRQQAYVAISNEVPYIATYRKVGDDYEPVVKTVQDGVMFVAHGVISDDRRTVALTVAPAISKFWGFDETTFDQAPPGKRLIVQTPDVESLGTRAEMTLADGGHGMLYMGSVTAHRLFDNIDKNADDQRAVLVIVTPRIIEPQADGSPGPPAPPSSRSTSMR